MEKTTISSENVKPSSPTPVELRTFKLSMLDQVPSFLPLQFYFAKTSTMSCQEIDEQLKTSLALTLTRFYPLAGRASADCKSVDCSDQGVPFLVENIKKGHQLSDLLKPNVDPMLHGQLFPCKMGSDEEWRPGCNVVMVKVTHFECGGVALGVVFWHMVVDVVTIACFLKYWSATVRGLPPGPEPDYVFRSLFPQKDEFPNAIANVKQEGKFVIRHYVFDGPTIRRLKAESSSNGVGSPSRFEVATTLLWKGYMVASLANHHKESAIMHLVNLRRRTQPPLPSECFGNIISVGVASYSNIGDEHEHDVLRHLVKKIRDATCKIDDEYVKRICGDKGYLGLRENEKLTWNGIPEEVDCLVVSSWCGMGFYDVDLGQGNPVWVAPFACCELSSALRNGVILMDTKLGDGVEAWVILKQQYMEVFENVEELKNHASVSSL